MEESINLIEEVINIDDRLDLNNIKKINNYIGEILANTDNLILDKFENKFEHIDRTNNSHRYSDTYDIIDEDNDFLVLDGCTIFLETKIIYNIERVIKKEKMLFMKMIY